MPPTLESVEADALQLTPAERERLIERLVVTLDADPDVEKAWAEEVERRHREMESGADVLLDGPATLAELKREFA
jgi:putative addiction module component (TIGR02574 family)